MASDDPSAEVLVRDVCSILHSVPGRLRLRLAPDAAARLSAVQAALEGAGGVRAVRPNRSARSMVVEYDAATTTEHNLLDLPLNGAAPADGDVFHDAVEATARVPAMPTEVWAVLSDIDELSTVMGQHIRLRQIVDTDHWTVDLRLPGGVDHATVEVMERRPPARLVMDIRGRYRARLSIALRRDGDATVVRERLEYQQPRGLVARLAGGLAVRPSLSAELAAHLRRVARLVLERRSR